MERREKARSKEAKVQCQSIIGYRSYVASCGFLQHNVNVGDRLHHVESCHSLLLEGPAQSVATDILVGPSMSIKLSGMIC
jgi:hypothetical protein